MERSKRRSISIKSGSSGVIGSTRKTLNSIRSKMARSPTAIEPAVIGDAIVAGVVGPAGDGLRERPLPTQGVGEVEIGALVRSKRRRQGLSQRNSCLERAGSSQRRSCSRANSPICRAASRSAGKRPGSAHRRPGSPPGPAQRRQPLDRGAKAGQCFDETSDPLFGRVESAELIERIVKAVGTGAFPLGGPGQRIRLLADQIEAGRNGRDLSHRDRHHPLARNDRAAWRTRIGSLAMTSAGG